MTKWAVQDAKARFSELLETTLACGPQMVTKRGVEAAVLVPIEEWRRLQGAAKRSGLEVLLGDGPRFDLPLPKRGSGRWRMDL